MEQKKFDTIAIPLTYDEQIIHKQDEIDEIDEELGIVENKRSNLQLKRTILKDAISHIHNQKNYKRGIDLINNMEKLGFINKIKLDVLQAANFNRQVLECLIAYVKPGGLALLDYEDAIAVFPDEEFCKWKLIYG